jgi:DNA ligase-1
MKPMLAGTVKDISKVQYPAYCTPKIDGIRCLIVDGYPVSRSLKLIPNKHIQKTLRSLPEGLDGELMLKGNKPFNEVSSAMMRIEGEPDFQYWVFDQIRDEKYLERIQIVEEMLETGALPACVIVLTPVEILNEENLLKFETDCLVQNYEGVMIRNNGPYKFGRSSVNQGFLLKLKRFHDGEAEILDFLEQMENTNEKTRDNLGHGVRSSHKDGMVPKDTLGALLVRDLKTGIKFKIGTGFDDNLRAHIWFNCKEYADRIVKYKSQACGAKEKPRFPVFLGFRDERDM